MSDSKTTGIIDNLLEQRSETSWLEFKENNAEPSMVGKLISALSNSAQLADQHFAYVIWGIRNTDQKVVGTTFKPARQTQEGQPLEFWLSQRLQPDVAFTFESADYRGISIVLLKIPSATTSPVEFERTAYIRIGSATPRLSNYPDRQRELWTKFQSYAWEHGLASQFSDSDAVLEKLDYASYFDLTNQPLPKNQNSILRRLMADRLLQQDVNGLWAVTNLGAILFAKRLDDFHSSIARKAIRLVAYAGPSRADAVEHRRDIQRGYAVGFTDLIDYLDILLPQRE